MRTTPPSAWSPRRCTCHPGVDQLRAWGHGPLTGAVRSGPTPCAGGHPTFRRARSSRVGWRSPRRGMPALPVTQPPKLAADPAGGGIVGPRRERRARPRRPGRAAVNATRAPRSPSSCRSSPSAGVIAFLVLWRRFGKEPTPPRRSASTSATCPTTRRPSSAASCTGARSARPAFSATILDLAQRGFLQVREIREDRVLLADKIDYELTRTDQTVTQLKGFERSALDQVFADGSPVMQSEIAHNARGHQTESLSRWNAFKADAATEPAQPQVHQRPPLQAVPPQHPRGDRRRPRRRRRARPPALGDRRDRRRLGGRADRAHPPAAPAQPRGPGALPRSGVAYGTTCTTSASSPTRRSATSCSGSATSCTRPRSG